MRRHPRNTAQRLRFAVEVLPRRTREAMLRGIERNRIIAGGYVDNSSGGVCPMLAAHRNGGRTTESTCFARAWDGFTGAKRPRLATKHEVHTLASYLELSLLREEQQETSVAALAKQIRAERERVAARPAAREATRSEQPERTDKRGRSTIRIWRRKRAAELSRERQPS